MLLEIWSDVVCPWCYIGKRRLERALAAFPHADHVEIVYRSFELDPDAPVVGVETVAESLARNYGLSVEDTRRMMERGDQIASTEGLTFRHHDTMHTRTTDAHRLLHLARETGLQAELSEALLAAFFTRGESMGDHDVLRKAAAHVGIDASRVEEVLAGDDYADAVRADVARARAYGATGVPFFVVDGRYGVAGAQSAEVLRGLLERAWADAKPLEMVAQKVAQVVAQGEDGGPDGCAC